MNKEELVFEMFKERIGKQYIATLKNGITIGVQQNVYIELKDYCQKIGADFSKVQKLLNKYKNQLFIKEKSKSLDHRVEYNLGATAMDLHAKIRKNINNKEQKKVSKFIEKVKN